MANVKNKHQDNKKRERNYDTQPDTIIVVDACATP